MEPRFGHDFSHVRVHTGQHAAEAADAVAARAFTVGRDIVFAADQFSPRSWDGQRLLAHELTHTLQQGHNATLPAQVSAPADRYEQAADRVADAVVSGKATQSWVADKSTPVSGTSNLLFRTATFDRGKPTPDINPAEDIGANIIKPADLFLGKTDFLLNGTLFTGASEDAIRKAIHVPSIASASTTLPVGQEGKTVPGVECWFDSVPDNKGTLDMRLLTDKTWTYVTDKPNLAKRFPSLKACDVGSGKVTFAVRGEPSDGELRKRVAAHEKVHGDDDEAAFNNFLKPWDTEITKRHKDNKRSKGPNMTVCEALLYLGTQKPGDVAVAMANEIDSKARSFHNTAAGSKPSTQPEKPDSDCNNVKARTGYAD